MTVDYLVVGLGLAGSNVVCELEKRRKTYLVYDDDRRPASKVAAGLMNPITGRNYVKSWRIDELLEVAVRNYRWFDQWLAGDYYHDLDIRRVLNNPSEENKWASRLSDPSYKDYLKEEIPHELSEYGFNDSDRVIHVHNAYRVETNKLVEDLKSRLKAMGKLRSESFDFSKVNHHDHSYNDVNYRHLICCEGALNHDSPFSNIPVIRNLGEVFFIDILDKKPSFAYKKKVFIVPLHQYYWVGGTYTNLSPDEPVKPDYERLKKGLDDTFKGRYDIVEMTWGIRPTVPDRKPLIGRHEEHEDTFILNGLGTKGSTLGPYGAKKLLDHIESREDLDDQISVSRYFER